MTDAKRVELFNRVCDILGGGDYVLEDIQDTDVLLDELHLHHERIDSGLTKGVWVSFDPEWVVKFPLAEREVDECAYEVEYYIHAVEYGIDDVFLETVYLGEFNHIKFYAQRRFDHSYECRGSLRYYDDYSKELKDYVDQNEDFICRQFDCGDNGEFVMDIIEYYGEAYGDKISNFIDHYDIGDLHDGNVGYLHDRPVICDYSGVH